MTWMEAAFGLLTLLRGVCPMKDGLSCKILHDCGLQDPATFQQLGIMQNFDSGSLQPSNLAPQCEMSLG